MIKTVGDLRRALEAFEDWDAFQIEHERDGSVYQLDVEDVTGPHAIGARCRVILSRVPMPLLPSQLRRY